MLKILTWTEKLYWPYSSCFCPCQPWKQVNLFDLAQFSSFRRLSFDGFSYSLYSETSCRNLPFFRRPLGCFASQVFDDKRRNLGPLLEVEKIVAKVEGSRSSIVSELSEFQMLQHARFRWHMCWLLNCVIWRKNSKRLWNPVLSFALARGRKMEHCMIGDSRTDKELKIRATNKSLVMWLAAF